MIKFDLKVARKLLVVYIHCTCKRSPKYLTEIYPEKVLLKNIRLYPFPGRDSIFLWLCGRVWLNYCSIFWASRINSHLTGSILECPNWDLRKLFGIFSEFKIIKQKLTGLVAEEHLMLNYCVPHCLRCLLQWSQMWWCAIRFTVYSKDWKDDFIKNCLSSTRYISFGYWLLPSYVCSLIIIIS